MRFPRHLPALWSAAAGLALGLVLGVPLGVSLVRRGGLEADPAPLRNGYGIAPAAPLLTCGDLVKLPNPPRDGLWRAGLVEVAGRCGRQSAAALGAPEAAASGQIPISR